MAPSVPLPAANLLRHETSPYLLQHANNPVHWRAWSVAALEEARVQNRPILLSIGYAACHWCHVMAHESFEDPDTAAQMNATFVNIKVDREERPDIDAIYMAALHALGEQGGWPLTMFLTPEGEPFWGGTYFPPEPRWGRPSFRQVLTGVAEAYRTGHEMVTHNSRALRQSLAAMAAPRPGALLTPAHLDQVASALLRLTDPVEGGLAGAPKFPNAPIFRFVWQDSFRGDHGIGREAMHLMLEKMSQGGIYDHLGGGFSRYSTDAVWLVPHFEKMLYDNGQLLELLALAHADRPSPLYAARAAETVGWLDRDMTGACNAAGQAAFAASEDADSEGEEGKFYVWSQSEIDRVLGPDAASFSSAYDVTPSGNWEGKNILRRVTPPGTDAEETALARSREKLLEVRAARVRPGRDDKVLADWNGLTIAGLVRAAAVFDEPEWLARAESAFDFVMAELANVDGRVHHAWRLGRVAAAGLLDDQAAMARAALTLFEATGNTARLAQATRLAEAALAHFPDGHGGFYTSANDASDVPLTRPRTAGDNATPAGNGVMAEVLARLAHLTGDPAWRGHAEAVIRAFTGAEDQLAAMPSLLAAADLLEEATDVVIAGDPAHPLARALGATALAAADPTVTLLRAPDPAGLPEGHPAHGKQAGQAGASAYVCRRGTCGLPLSDPAALALELGRRSRRPFRPASGSS
ncbi:MAG: thioredoxin domain-containing protein [Alphaproteobacteria bacterium]|nr:thioredoxin domain-containing protein [Alphaproteobacteria bacterium]